MSSWWDGGYQWYTNLITNIESGVNSFVDPADDEVTESGTTQYETTTTYADPLRTTKCLFVPEMSDFFTEEELNSGYHSKEEYDNAIKNYGLIYKAQKFSNADTVDKLLDYATDYIKNNFHGGLTSFTVTALDQHLLGEMNKRKYMSGDRVRVMYPDPVTHNEVTQNLTVISADYDLYNPENNAYKVGIPDSTLNKVYGDTSTSGSGGSSGTTSSTESDAGDNTNMNELTDTLDETNRNITEIWWANIGRIVANGGTPSGDDLLTPQQKNPGSNIWYTMVADLFKTSDLQTIKAKISNLLEAKFISCSESVEAKQVNSTKVATTDAEIESGEITLGEKVYSPDVVNNRPTVSIDGTPFTLMNDNNGEFKLGDNTIGFEKDNDQMIMIYNGQRLLLKTEEITP